MSKTPKVSIVVPCFNAVRTVRETLDSALAQTRSATVPEIEIVAVNDGSTDETHQILLAYAAKHPSVRVVHQPNGGLAAARNSGIAAARGEIIALLDADDLLDANYVDRHVNNLEASDADISFGRVRYVDMAGQPTGKETNPKLVGLTPEDFLISNPCTAFLVIRRSVFDHVGAFDPRLRSVEDQEWLFRARCGDAKLSGLNEVLASYRITPGSLSADTAAMQRAFDTMLNAARQLAPVLVDRHEARARAAHLRYSARRIIDHGGDMSLAQSKMRAALRLAPGLLLREPKQTLATLVASHLPTLAPLIFARRHMPGRA